MTNVRHAAVSVLLRLDDVRTTLAAELEAARDGIDDRRDRGLLVELTTGALRWRNELDALITAASRRRIADIDRRALAVLRIGAYQLRHLDRVPDHAIVHQSVEIVRTVGAPRAAGFVNAVLRALIRRGPALSLPRRPGPGAGEDRVLTYLTTTLSHPTWLVRRWLRRHGFDATERWCQFNNTPPDITMRAVGSMTAEAILQQLRDEGIEATPAPHVADAVRITPGALGRISPALRDLVVVQDEGSQLVARFAGARPGERVLDVCAAPGGKTLVLAGDLALGKARPFEPSNPGPLEPGSRRSLLVAGDRRPGRVALVMDTVRRSGLSVPIVAHDALTGLPFGPVFDLVVVDAPCSGLGTLRRDPDLKWSRQEADLPGLAQDQRRMLSVAAACVRPGGRLVYATCSSEPEENTGVVSAFLEEDPRFAAMRAEDVTGRQAGPLVRLVDEAGHLATQPFRDGLDAYFAAILVRRLSA